MCVRPTKVLLDKKEETTMETLLQVIFLGLCIMYLVVMINWVQKIGEVSVKTYKDISETANEATRGIQELRAKGKETCDRLEKFFGEKANQEILAKAAEDIIAKGVQRGISGGVEESIEILRRKVAERRAAVDARVEARQLANHK